MSPDSELVQRWTMAFVLGELIGFIPPAVTGAALGAAGASDPVMVVGLTLAGSLEGAAIGAFQAHVLRRYLPGIRSRDWIIATAVAAAFAWLVGMGGAAAMGAQSDPSPLLALLVPAWLAALCAMGFTQWLVLRHALPHSGSWIPMNALAWLVGVMVPIVALMLIPDGWPMAGRVVTAVVAAVVMGIVVGLITGAWLRHLLTRGGRLTHTTGG